jgi:predicted alpha/beta hydrolase family esterase
MIKNIKAIIIPGNGDDNPEDKWFPYVQRELEKLGIKVTNVKFPDPVLARKEFRLPFIEKLGADENTILIGHSSGAVAAMRYAENYKILGSVLVGSYTSHLGDENEKKSGYFDIPWDWKAIKDNQKWIIQFASTDDPFIPIEEPRKIHNELETIYHEYTDQGHFGGHDGKFEFPEMIEAIRNLI